MGGLEGLVQLALTEVALEGAEGVRACCRGLLVLLLVFLLLLLVLFQLLCLLLDLAG